MKKYFNILILGLSFLCLSCTELEEKQYNVINPNIFPQTEADADAIVVAAAYGPFVSNWYNGLFRSAVQGLHVLTELTTDIGNCQWGGSEVSELETLNFRPTGIIGIRAYRDYINSVSRMTQAIVNIEKMNLPEGKKNALIAQLRCGRGWLVYLLYDLYGGIQIASEEQLVNVDADAVLPRLSTDETVAYIKDDLTNALQYLPDRLYKSDANYGRYTKALAYTILMKLYMHEKDWQNAVKCGKELMSPKYGFALVEHYKDIFTLENEGNDETIWATVNSRNVNQQLWLAHVLPSVYPTSNKNIQKWSGYRVMWSFYNTFDSNDERLEVLIGDFVGTDGVRYNEENAGGVLTEGALPVKYGEDPAATGEESQVDWIVYRYADVVTLLAEAIVRQNNCVDSEAVELLNMVRVRAGLNAYTTSDFASPDDFLETILLERGHELWFENCRRSDLIRYGKYIEYAKKYRNSTAAKDYMTLMPLPQSVVDEGKGQVVQNPGY